MRTQYFFLCPTLVTRRKKKFFFISLPSSKLTISLISTYRHYAIDIADPSCMQEACHMNFVIDLAHCEVSMFQWLQHLGAKSQGLRFNSTWGLKSFSLSHARDEMKKPSFSIECLSWKLNWPIWLVRYQDDYFFPIWRYFAYAWTYFN